MVATSNEVLEIFERIPCAILDSFGNVGVGANAHDAFEDLRAQAGCLSDEITDEWERCYYDIEERFLVAREPEELFLQARLLLRAIEAFGYCPEGLLEQAAVQAAVSAPSMLYGAMVRFVASY